MSNKEKKQGIPLGHFPCPECGSVSEKSLENEWLGKTFKMEDGSIVKIIAYRKSRSLTVEFLDTGYILNTRLSRVKLGKLKDRLKPSVKGVGIIGLDKISTARKHHREYALWDGMLDRCYNEITQKKQKAYNGCSVSDDFLFYPNFKKWCNEQIGFNSVDEFGRSFNLDKDILFKNNKIYSPQTCCFVPSEINAIMASCKRDKGSTMVGTAYDKKLKKYRSAITREGVKTHLGCFEKEIDAFMVYKVEKEAHIKLVAEKWKNEIDIRVYEALISHQVETTD